MRHSAQMYSTPTGIRTPVDGLRTRQRGSTSARNNANSANRSVNRRDNAPLAPVDDGDLKRVVAEWPKLSKSIRHAVLVLVDSISLDESDE